MVARWEGGTTTAAQGISDDAASFGGAVTAAVAAVADKRVRRASSENVETSARRR